MMLVMAAFLTSPSVSAETCKVNHTQSNVTIPLTVQLPDNISVLPVGSILFKKEATLSQLSNVHGVISSDCKEQFKRFLIAKLSAPQIGKDIYATALPGIGIKLTVIYDNPGDAHQEWTPPFNLQLQNISNKEISTDNIRFRLEIVKTGEIGAGGMIHFNAPALMVLSDNALVVSLVMTLIMPKAHCTIQLASPQIELPAIKTSELKTSKAMPDVAVNVSLSCINVNKASIRVDGMTNKDRPTIFENVAPETPAKNVGVEMLFNKSVMKLNNPIDLIVPQQKSYPLPLSVRYAKTESNVTGGKVKAQITIHIDYL